jgi:hypothetical protein
VLCTRLLVYRRSDRCSSISAPLSQCVLIATPTYVPSYLLLYMCPQNLRVLLTLFSGLLAQHRLPRLCLSHARRYIERDRCVCVCVCVCVRVRVYISSLSVCVSLRLLCFSHLPVSQRYEDLKKKKTDTKKKRDKKIETRTHKKERHVQSSTCFSKVYTAVYIQFVYSTSTPEA